MNHSIEGLSMPKHYICQKCGCIVDLTAYFYHDSIVQKLSLREYCYECHYWENLLSNPPAHHHIINRQFFTAPPTEELNENTRFILTADGEPVATDELFNYGYIPPAFLNDNPDTATFINRRNYKFIINNKMFECYRLGCWDRKHCIWFKGQMGWNTIPVSHKMGDEKCPMFRFKKNPNQ